MGETPYTLGELADAGLKLRLVCNNRCCSRGRKEVRIDPGALAEKLGRDRPIYGVWTSMKCGACGASGKLRGNLFAMAEFAPVPMGLRNEFRRCQEG